MTQPRCMLVVICSALTLAGCGGASGPVPDVVGERLDVARSEMDDAGYDTEEIGGGAFGAIDESNWTVCETRPEAGASDTGTVKLIVDRSCSESASSDDRSRDEGQSSATNPASTPKPERKRKRKRSSASSRITVPAVVGMNHQAAQNRMQAAGLYNLRERDASGQGRLLLYDRNWVVVDQRPAPGTSATELTRVTLFSVKDGEQ